MIRDRLMKWCRNAVVGCAIASVASVAPVSRVDAERGTVPTAPPTQTAATASTWSLVPNPYVVNNPMAFTEIECVTVNWCVRIGSRWVSPYAVAAVDMWDGVQWTAMNVPTSASGDTYLYSVSCASTTLCTAVGRRTDAGFTRAWAFALRWDGSTWTNSSPSLSGTYHQFNAVSCSGSMCMAVGVINNSLLVERWTGSAWVRERTRSGLTNDWAQSVACGSPTDCLVTGLGDSTTRSQVPIAMLWTSGTWTVAATPTTTPGSTFRLACTSATFCLAVGGDTAPAGRQPRDAQIFLVVHIWNGSAWSTAPAPHDDLTYITDLDCLATDDCTAVGATRWGTGVPRMLASHWDGVAWADAALPIAGGGFDQLNGVSCPTIAMCFAVGSAADNNLVNGSQFMIELSTGTVRHVAVTWTASEAARINQIGQYLGVSPSEVQRTSVYALAFLAGLLPAGTTPIAPDPAGTATTYVTDWDQSEFSVLSAVTAKFALSDVQATRFSVGVVGYLLALGGH